MTGPEQEQWVALGRVSGVHGIKGWVKVESWTRPREAILDYPCWRLGEVRTPHRLRDARGAQRGLTAALVGITDRDAAERLVGAEIAVPREEMPEPEADSWYWSDLVGCEVRTRDGVKLGRVERLLETGANDVLVVGGERERLIPFVPGATVHEVDLEAGQIEVDWHPDD